MSIKSSSFQSSNSSQSDRARPQLSIPNPPDPATAVTNAAALGRQYLDARPIVSRHQDSTSVLLRNFIVASGCLEVLGLSQD